MKFLPVLISYAYANCFDWNLVREYSSDLNLLIDCGAFTVHKKGKKIQLDEYYDFLSTIDYEVDGYFALDSIGDPKKTWENFIQMKNDGFDPLPIFTRGDKIERADAYYEHSDILALGGLRAGGINDYGYVKHWMEHAARGRKVHWLGFAPHDLILFYHPFSVDAINWKRALLYGDLVVWNGIKFVKAKRTDFSKKGTIPIDREVRKLGFVPALLRQEESWRGVHTYAHEISTASMFKYVETLERKCKVRFYFVCNAQHELDFLYTIFKGGTYGGCRGKNI